METGMEASGGTPLSHAAAVAPLDPLPDQQVADAPPAPHPAQPEAVLQIGGLQQNSSSSSTNDPVPSALSLSGSGHSSSALSGWCKWVQYLVCCQWLWKWIIRPWQARRASYSLPSLRKNPVLMILAVWHSYALWMALCAIVCTAGSALLSWYIGWYQLIPYKGSNEGQHFPYFDFFALFLRSWLLVNLVSELCRFGYLLLLDAWCLDAFGAYRRALCGFAYVDMSEHEALRSQGLWPQRILNSRGRQWLDKLVQVLIYASFDGAPLLAAAWAMSNDIEDALWEARLKLFQVLANVAIFHTCLYFVIWLACDVWQKVVSFREAWHEDAVEWAERPAELGGLQLRSQPRRTCCFWRSEASEGLPSEMSLVQEEEEGRGSWRCPRFAHCCRRITLQRRLVQAPSPLLPVSDCVTNPRLQDCTKSRGVQTEAMLRDPVADELSMCVWLCSLLETLAWELFFLALLCGLVCIALFLKTVLVLSLCILGALLLLFWRCRWGFTQDPWVKSRMQQWGEAMCSLDHEERWAVHTSFGLVVIMQGGLFFFMKEWLGLEVCAVVLLVVMLREVALQCERNRGWWLGSCEGVAIWLVVSVMTGYALGRAEGLSTLLMACLHQFGLRQSRHQGSRLVKVIFVLMYTMQMLIVGATQLSAGHFEVSDWTAFPAGGNLSTVPWTSSKGHSLVCGASFADGEMADLNIGDFGLLSATAYESNATMQRVLGQLMPGWRVAYKRYASKLNGTSRDWTTFFEYSNPTNTTSVIAIRGTDTTLDVLSDINIWLNAALIQGFEILGPTLYWSISEAVSFWSNIVRGEVSAEEHFKELMDYVKQRIADEPRRQFYITGHSLGGGLAMLVASQVDIKAITFMAPGVVRTRYSVFNRTTLLPGLGARTITVSPTHDLVSRLDQQAGIVVPVDCLKDPLSCHQIWPSAVCPIFETCGSMRPYRSIQLPCSQCPTMCS